MATASKHGEPDDVTANLGARRFVDALYAIGFRSNGRKQSSRNKLLALSSMSYQYAMNQGQVNLDGIIAFGVGIIEDKTDEIRICKFHYQSYFISAVHEQTVCGIYCGVSSKAQRYPCSSLSKMSSQEFQSSDADFP